MPPNHAVCVVLTSSETLGYSVEGALPSAELSVVLCLTLLSDPAELRDLKEDRLTSVSLCPPEQG